MQNFTMVETTGVKSSAVMIRPYIDGNFENMGLQNYGLAVHEGITHTEQLACIEINGVKRYLTGLNEFAPEIKLIKNPEERAARVKAIRTAVKELEEELAANILDIEDKEFWNKVSLLRPDNAEFWGKISLSCSNEPTPLDPSKPYDRIRLIAIDNGGFSMVAKSLDDARSRPRPLKFYLDRQEETIATKTESKKLRNKALAELQKLYDKNMIKLFYVAKAVDANSVQYKKATPNDVVYDNMDRYINGEGVERNKVRAAESFVDAANLDIETLKLKAIIKDATFYKIIATKSDGFIHHLDSNTMMGRNPSEILEFLKNPLNEKILEQIMKRVEKYWNQ